MIQVRNPDVAAALITELEFPMTPILGEAASTVGELVGVQGFEPPSWRALAAGEGHLTANQQSSSLELQCEGGNMRRRQEWNDELPVWPPL